MAETPGTTAIRESRPVLSRFWYEQALTDLARTTAFARHQRFCKFGGTHGVRSHAAFSDKADQIRRNEHRRDREGIDTIEAEARDLALSRRDQLRRQLTAASSWFIYGAHIKGWRRARSIEKRVAAEGISDLRVPVIECKLMMLMRFRQLARLARVPFVAAAIRRSAARVYNTTRETLEAAGNFGGSQALRLNAQRIGLSASGEMVLPPIEGYASLGAIGMLSVAVRDAVRTQGPWRLVPDQRKACLWGIRNARHYAWMHEEWKFRWMLLVRGEGAFGCVTSLRGGGRSAIHSTVCSAVSFRS